MYCFYFFFLNEIFKETYLLLSFLRLRYGKNGAISSAGFSEPSDASDDDLKLWLPPVDSPPPDIEIETSKFLLTYVGDHFCDLVEMEKEAKKLHMEVGMCFFKNKNIWLKLCFQKPF